MRVCCKNHNHRRLGPVRCEAPGCNALVVEIDDPADAGAGAAPGLGEASEPAKGATLATAKDSAETHGGVEALSTGDAPEAARSDLDEDSESDDFAANVEAAKGEAPPRSGGEPDVADVDAIEAPPQGRRLDIAEPTAQDSLQRDREPDVRLDARNETATFSPPPDASEAHSMGELPEAAPSDLIENNKSDNFAANAAAAKGGAQPQASPEPEVAAVAAIEPPPQGKHLDVGEPVTQDSLQRDREPVARLDAHDKTETFVPSPDASGHGAPQPNAAAPPDPPTSRIDGSGSARNDAPEPPIASSPQLHPARARPKFAVVAVLAFVAMLFSAAIGLYMRHDHVDPGDQAWSKIANSHDPADFLAFVRKFPESPHAVLANETAMRLEVEQRLAELKREEQQLAESRRAAQDAQPPTSGSEPGGVSPEKKEPPPAPVPVPAPVPDRSSPMNSLNAGNANIAEVAKEVIEALRTEGIVARGYIGVQLQPLTREIAESLGLTSTSGALVAVARPDGPAARAGIVAGDVITAVNGEQIDHPRDLARKIAPIGPNDLVEVSYIHRGAARTTTVRLGRTPDDRPAETPPPAAKSARSTLARFGLSLSPATESVGAGKTGVVVIQVDPDGPAARKGLRAGDVILEAGGRPVADPADVVQAVDDARKFGLRAVMLRIRSGGVMRFLILSSEDS